MICRLFCAVAACTLLAYGSPATASTESFPVWLEELRSEAVSRGISRATVDAALAGVEPIPRVIELDRRQPEGKWTYAQYYERVMGGDRISRGVEAYKANRATLEAVARDYGVPANIIVALWGIETSYGRITGGFPVVAALATLAHDGRRSAFFRKELLDALQILDEGHIAVDDMQGSWAGAMGQSQFMPSSFRNFAVDRNGDGRRDIWGTKADVFASAANYLKRSGWRPGERWGREVRLPAGFDRDLIGLDTQKSVNEWAGAGVVRVDGGRLPVSDMQGSIIQEDGPGARAFLVYDNFRTILRWNRSNYFATTVGLLSDRIAWGAR